MMDLCTVKSYKAKPRVKVSFELTRGETMALMNALKGYKSVVGQDVAAYLRNALTKAGMSELLGDDNTKGAIAGQAVTAATNVVASGQEG